MNGYHNEDREAPIDSYRAIAKPLMRDVMQAVRAGQSDAQIIEGLGALPAQIEWARNPPPLRYEPTDRYLITVEGIRHALFRTSAETLYGAQETARRVSDWSGHRGKPVVVIDLHAQPREVPAFSGGTRTKKGPVEVYRCTTNRSSSRSTEVGGYDEGARSA